MELVSHFTSQFRLESNDAEPGCLQCTLVFAQAQKQAWKAFTLSTFVCTGTLVQACILRKYA